MTAFDIPAILCEYAGAGPDASSKYRYLGDITYDDYGVGVTEHPRVMEVAEVVLEEVRGHCVIYNLAGRDFAKVQVSIHVRQAFSAPSSDRLTFSVGPRKPDSSRCEWGQEG